MLKKLTSIVVLLLLCLSFLLPANTPALAATTEQANTIIMEMSGTTSEDIRDLRSGEGKIFKRVAKLIENLKAEGQTPEDAQPVIIVVRKKSSKKGLLD